MQGSQKEFLNYTGRCAHCTKSMMINNIFNGGQSSDGTMYCKICAVALNNSNPDSIRYCRGDNYGINKMKELYFQCALLCVEIGDEDGAVEYLRKAGPLQVGFGLAQFGLELLRQRSS